MNLSRNDQKLHLTKTKITNLIISYLAESHQCIDKDIRSILNYDSLNINRNKSVKGEHDYISTFKSINFLIIVFWSTWGTVFCHNSGQSLVSVSGGVHVRWLTADDLIIWTNEQKIQPQMGTTLSLYLT